MTTHKTVYLDNNATTKIDPMVLDAMMPFLTERYGNASSIHTFGGSLHKVVDRARGQVAALLNCAPEEILFTSGGTESDNTAIAGALRGEENKKRIITSRVEHPAVLAMCRDLSRAGWSVAEIGVDGHGHLDMDALSAAMTDDVALVTIMAANNETGVLFDINAMADMAEQRGIIFHTDAVQAVGKIPMDMARTPIDMLSLSGHKLHGPKGVGALYVRKGTPLRPRMIGGHQERGLRAGTENIAGIAGLGAACELAAKNMKHEQTVVRALRDRLEEGLLARCEHSHINGDRARRLPNTSNISFEYIEGEGILLRLDHLGIAASSGSACTSGSLEPSHVLRAMGVPFTSVHGSIRFSLSRFTTESEIDYVLEHMPGVIETLRAMSPFTSQNGWTGSVMH